MAREAGRGAMPEVVPVDEPPVRPSAPIAAEIKRDLSPSPDQVWESASKLATVWADEVFQIRDLALRRAALERLDSALGTGASEESLAALFILRRISGKLGEYDSGRHLEAVVAYLTSPSYLHRQAALAALASVGAGEETLEHAIPLAEDPNATVRTFAAGAIAGLAKGDLTGAASDPVLKLLSDTDRSVQWPALRIVADAKRISPELENRLIVLSRSEDWATSLRALSAVGRHAAASEPLRGCLLDALENAAYLPVRRQAAKLLKRLPQAQHEIVADEAVKILSRAEGVGDRVHCIELLGACGSARHLAFLEGFSGNRMLTKGDQVQIESAVKRLRERLGR
jgi:hypothetical protein